MKLVDAADIAVRPRLREPHGECIYDRHALAQLVTEHDPGVEVAALAVLLHRSARPAGRIDKRRREYELARTGVRSRHDIHHLVQVAGECHRVWVVRGSVHAPRHGIAGPDLHGAREVLVQRAGAPRSTDQYCQFARGEDGRLLFLNRIGIRIAAGHDQDGEQRQEYDQLLHSGSPNVNSRR